VGNEIVEVYEKLLAEKDKIIDQQKEFLIQQQHVLEQLVYKLNLLTHPPVQPGTVTNAIMTPDIFKALNLNMQGVMDAWKVLNIAPGAEMAEVADWDAPKKMDQPDENPAGPVNTSEVLGKSVDTEEKTEKTEEAEENELSSPAFLSAIANSVQPQDS
jgi:hypothetical protein